METGSSCTSALVDNATIIKDSKTSMTGGPDCYHRKNLGVNGVIDARQCGVRGDGTTDDYAALTTCLDLAGVAGLSLGTGANPVVVNTGGGVILDNSQDIVIPPNVELTCGGNNPSDVPGDDYRIKSGAGNVQLTNAIILDPQYKISMPHAGGTNSKNAAFTGCTLEAGVGTGSPPNPYSPSVWYADCIPTTTPVVPCTTDLTPKPYLRSAIYEQSAFAPGGPAAGSVGISIGTDHDTVRNVTVLGFGTCYSLEGGVRPIIDHLVGDCNTGISITDSNNPHIDGVNIAAALSSGAYATYIGDIETISDSGGVYQVSAEVDDFYTSDSVGLKAGDTVWIATGKTGGVQSARGRWTIGTPTTSLSCRSGHSCQTFTLTNSISTGVNAMGNIKTAIASGTPPTAIQGVTSLNFKLISPGQVVTDSTDGTCITHSPAPDTTVVAVWPARGIVYLSAPVLCNHTGDTFHFADVATFSPNFLCTTADVTDGETTDPQTGCLYIDASFRYGDGFYENNDGGASVVNCTVFEHMVAFHLSTGASNGRWTNCATGNNNTLPDRNLAAMATDGNLISLLISGDHNLPPDSLEDGCGLSWSNSVLGQHRPVAIVIQSNCNDVNRFSNVSIGVDNGQQNGIKLELDGGGVVLANAAGGGEGSIFKADAGYGGPPTTLNISNNSLPDTMLYQEDSAASSNTTGCGNVFAVPTPYLCAPSSFAQVPGGRLTLTQGQPVMTTDVTGATHVYYAPYTGQQVPIYNSATGAFGLVDIGSNGLALDLDAGTQVAGFVYDIFAEIGASASGALCSGPAWSGSGVSRSASAQIKQINGIWVNASAIGCNFSSGGTSGSYPCLPAECTYLGSVYMTANGQTAQQFGPASGPGGGAPCLCLYNAYNRVKLSSRSLDTNGSYTYNTATWRYMDASASNGVTVLDGLGQSPVSVVLTDALSNGSASGTPRIAGMGIDFLPPGGTIVAPTLTAKGSSTTQGTYNVGEAVPPLFGVWTAHAIEKALGGATGNATFGGSGFQEVNVQVDD